MVFWVTAGAVKTPLLVIVPADADQATLVFEVPETLAENCCVPPETTVALDGLIET
jgi:hypothetical protein